MDLKPHDGQSVIFLHQLTHAIAQLRGIRPIPKGSYLEECRPVSLRVALKLPGHVGAHTVVDIVSATIYPHQEETRDKDTGLLIRRERRAEVIFDAVYPEKEPIDPDAKVEMAPVESLIPFQEMIKDGIFDGSTGTRNPVIRTVERVPNQDEEK